MKPIPPTSPKPLRQEKKSSTSKKRKSSGSVSMVTGATAPLPTPLPSLAQKTYMNPARNIRVLTEREKEKSRQQTALQTVQKNIRKHRTVLINTYKKEQAEYPDIFTTATQQKVEGLLEESLLALENVAIALEKEELQDSSKFPEIKAPFSKLVDKLDSMTKDCIQEAVVEKGKRSRSDNPLPNTKIPRPFSFPKDTEEGSSLGLEHLSLTSEIQEEAVVRPKTQPLQTSKTQTRKQQKALEKQQREEEQQRRKEERTTALAQRMPEDKAKASTRRKERKASNAPIKSTTPDAPDLDNEEIILYTRQGNDMNQETIIITQGVLEAGTPLLTLPESLLKLLKVAPRPQKREASIIVPNLNLNNPRTPTVLNETLLILKEVLAGLQIPSSDYLQASDIVLVEINASADVLTNLTEELLDYKKSFETKYIIAANAYKKLTEENKTTQKAMSLLHRIIQHNTPLSKNASPEEIFTFLQDIHKVICCFTDSLSYQKTCLEMIMSASLLLKKVIEYVPNPSTLILEDWDYLLSTPQTKMVFFPDMPIEIRSLRRGTSDILETANYNEILTCNTRILEIPVSLILNEIHKRALEREKEKKENK